MSKPKCDLCGKANNLTKTECCGNWICDDDDNYVLFSFAKNSCFRNHHKSTLCFHHYIEGHQGSDWRNCEECRTSLDTETYVWFGTNQYNFTKLENPPKYEPTRCKNCNEIIKVGEDAYTLRPDGKYCCFNDKPEEKPAQNTKSQASGNIQARHRSKSEDGLAQETDSNAMAIEDEVEPEPKKRGKSVRNKSVNKPAGDKKKNKTSKRPWVFIDEDPIKKLAGTQMARGRKKSSAGRKASSSRADSKTSNTAQAGKSNATSKSKSKSKYLSQGRKSDNNGGRYGKRKAKQDDEDLERSQSVSKAKTKKVKKNNVDNKNKKNIELDVAEPSTSSKSGKSFSGIRIGNARDTLDLARSTSTGKLNEKKKVQGIKKKT